MSDSGMPEFLCTRHAQRIIYEACDTCMEEWRRVELGAHRLRAERDEALAQVVTCRRLVERWRDKVPADVWEELSRIPDSARALLTRLEQAERVGEALSRASIRGLFVTEGMSEVQAAFTAWQEARDADAH